MLFILKPSKKGHYNSYIEFLERILPEGKYSVVQKEELQSKKPKKDKILLLDFDISDLIQIISWGFRNEIFLINVSIEELYFNKSKFLFNRKNLFEILKKINLLKIISTHRGAPYESNLECVDTLIYDIQYYDLLPVTVLKTEMPMELVDKHMMESIVSIINTSTDKYDLVELENAISLNSHITYVIVSRKVDLTKYENVIQINRFISDNELYYLYQNFNYFLVTTRTNRPSGIFGRTMQFNKFAIILKGSYNDGIQYPNSIVINNLSDVKKINFNKKPVQFDCTVFDDSLVLRNKLTL
jgi:hypothetical protein